jgi:hypothetical protein
MNAVDKDATAISRFRRQSNSRRTKRSTRRKSERVRFLRLLPKRKTPPQLNMCSAESEVFLRESK